MFSDLLKRLTAPEPEPLPSGDARLSLAALLVRLANSDGDYAPSEIARIDQTLAQRYGLDIDEARALRNEAEVLEAEAPDTVRFTRAIKDCVPYEDRVGVIEAMWSVVTADGQRDEEENSLMRMIAPMLGINDRDSNLARRRVEDRT